VATRYCDKKPQRLDEKIINFNIRFDLNASLVMADGNGLLTPMFISRRCTNAYYIDRDCDGYGVGICPDCPVLAPTYRLLWMQMI